MNEIDDVKPGEWVGWRENVLALIRQGDMQNAAHHLCMSFAGPYFEGDVVSEVDRLGEQMMFSHQEIAGRAPEFWPLIYSELVPEYVPEAFERLRRYGWHIRFAED